jgi:hypothetical protein
MLSQYLLFVTDFLSFVFVLFFAFCKKNQFQPPKSGIRWNTQSGGPYPSSSFPKEFFAVPLCTQQLHALTRCQNILMMQVPNEAERKNAAQVF